MGGERSVKRESLSLGLFVPYRQTHGVVCLVSSVVVVVDGETQSAL